MYRHLGGNHVYHRLSYAIYPQRWGIRVYTINWTLLDKRLTTESFCQIGKELTELITNIEFLWVMVDSFAVIQTVRGNDNLTPKQDLFYTLLPTYIFQEKKTVAYYLRMNLSTCSIG